MNCITVINASSAAFLTGQESAAFSNKVKNRNMWCDITPRWGDMTHIENMLYPINSTYYQLPIMVCFLL